MSNHGFNEHGTRSRGIPFSRIVFVIVLAAVILTVVVVWPTPIPRYQGDTLDKWLERLDAAKPMKDQKRAAAAIKGIDKKAVPYLRHELRRRDSRLMKWLAKEVGEPFEYTPAKDYRERALQAIEVLGPAARDLQPDLETMLNQGELPYRVVAAITSVNSNAMDVIINNLSHSNRSVRRAVAWELGNVGPHSEDTVNRLLIALKEPDPEVRSGAAHSLGIIRLFPHLVVPQLAASLDNTNRQFYLNLLLAIQSYGTNARDAIPSLTKLLGEREGALKGEVVATLRVVDEEAAAQAGFGRSDSVKMLRSTEEQAKIAAAVAIWQSRDEPQEFIPALIDSLSDTNVTIKRLAMTTLGNYGKAASNAVQTLARILDDPSESMRFQAASTIRRIDQLG